MLMPASAAAAAETAAGRASTLPGESFLRIEGVHKRFGSASVLAGIDLDIGDGEFVALLGPSGCGKTTLLRILCGIEQPSAGRIFSQGRDITMLPPAQRGFGVVFQSYALFPNLSAAQNVAYGLHGIAREHRSRRVREMLDLVGLAGHADHYPAQLSGGQQQRIALARALAPSPRLVLLDEPLSALDAQVREHLRGEIRGICDRLGVATVMVTHDQDEALAMADRVVLMHQGRIEQAAAPQVLYAAPRSVFAACFVGRMNLWAATVVGPETVRVGAVDLDFHAPPETVLVPGQRVRMGIRPEQLRLQAHDPAWERAPERLPLAANTVIASVLRTSFHGSHRRAWLSAAGFDGEIEADVPTTAGAPATGEGAALQLPAGERVRLQVPAAALVLVG